MPEAIRKGDKDNANPAHSVTASASKVYIVQQLAARQDDAMSGGYKVGSGSPKVFIEGKPAARAGDSSVKPGNPSYALVAGQGKVFIS